MKTSELIKILRRTKQCRFIEHGAQHDKWYSSITNKTFLIPRHKNKDVPTGTLNRILKDAGIKEGKK